ncbi:MAG: hypothetical protein H6558_22155 [Lewinellaceae bacterium]|nr:hypothetical protein [Lewinellaceae bacterium]MCB9296424.1 hypothetical protein [Lewinellaceae bacterium]MCO6491947.1 hypothetical protein [Phaeodactylibacter sp.]
MTLEVVNDRTENVKVFGNSESTVEYCQARLHENFTIYINAESQAAAVIERIRSELYASLSNVQVRVR